jgi:DNA-binding GntR family transcriptional regulator
MALGAAGEAGNAESLADQAYSILRDAILDGSLAPGKKLGQASLATELAVSDRTVREALVRLTAEGLLRREPYKELRVVGVSLEDIEDVVRMRSMLEGWAMELAASRISLEDLRQMRAMASSMEKSSWSSATNFQGANRDFHWIAIEGCGKRHLIQMLGRVWDLMLPYSLVENEPENSVARTERDFARLQRSHRQLVDALEKRNASMASAVIARHSKDVMELVRMDVKRKNKAERQESGRLFLQHLPPIRTSSSGSHRSEPGLLRESRS